MPNRTIISGILSFVLAASASYFLEISAQVAYPSFPKRALEAPTPTEGTPSNFQKCLREICVDFPAFSPEFNSCINSCFGNMSMPVSSVSMVKMSSSSPIFSTSYSSTNPSVVYSSQPAITRSSKKSKNDNLSKYCISYLGRQTSVRSECDIPLKQGFILFSVLRKQPSISVDNNIQKQFPNTGPSKNIPVEDIISKAIERMTYVDISLPTDSTSTTIIRQVIQNMKEILLSNGSSATWSLEKSNTIRQSLLLQLRLAQKIIASDSTSIHTIDDFLSTIGIIFQRLPAFIKVLTESQIVTDVSAKKIFEDYKRARESFLDTRSRCASDIENDLCVLSIFESIERLTDMRWVEPMFRTNTEVINAIQNLFKDLEIQWNVDFNSKNVPMIKTPYLE